MKPKHAYQLRKPQGWYGHIVSSFLKRHNNSIYMEMEKYLDVRENARLLEIGFGPGVGIRRLADQYPGIRIIGIDFSPLMCRKAGWTNRKHVRNGSVRLICGDFNKYDFREDRFDRVCFTNVIYFWDDYRAGLEKIHSLLDQGGTLLFQMADKPALEKNAVTNTAVFNKYTIDEVMLSMREIGYQNVRSFSLVSREGHYFITGSR